MVRFDDSFALRLKLKAQSPMIHFQARQTGATIRASEVKPKLDRFILNKLKKAEGVSDVQQLVKDERYCSIFRPSSDGKQPSALRYKMQIFCESEPTIVVINNDRSVVKQNEEAYRKLPSYTLYFGNSGTKKPDEQRLGVISDPIVTIHCFDKALRGLLEQYIEEFFLVTNFGTMQNKGFGGFAPDDFVKNGNLTDEQRRQIGAYLKDLTGTPVCCYATVNYRDQDYTPQFKCIESFYRLMKSGYNNPGTRERPREYKPSFLFQYMSKMGIGNEKAWMKQQGISPAIGYNAGKHTSGAKSRYVRAFFGTTGTIRYQGPKKGVWVNVTISSNKLERVPSPVRFKIIGDTVFITAESIDKDLYGAAFDFSSSMGSGTISAPETTDFPACSFDVADFLTKYVTHYNDLRNDLRRGGTLRDFLKGTSEVKKL